MDSKCPKCENNEFEAVNYTPKDSNFELMIIRCAQCKSVVGVLDSFNVGSLIKKLAARLGVDLNR